MQLLALGEWKEEVLNGLDKLIKEEYNELGEIINSIQTFSDSFQDILQERPKKSKSMVAEMGQIIKQQQAVINSLRAYSQELEDLYKSAFFKIQSIISAQIKPFWNNQDIHFQRIVREIRSKFSLKGEGWRQQLKVLESENSELKSILDSMIKLVQEQKRLKR